MKNRIKSYSFWTALSGAVVIFLNALGELFGFSVQDELVSGIIMAVAGILVVFGIVTMPNDNQNSEEEIEEDTEENVTQVTKEEDSRQEESKEEDGEKKLDEK